jgi:hypothetical protein
MSISVDLPEELENELSAEATQLGISLPEYVMRVLSTGLVRGKKPETGAELIEYWQNEGLVGTRPEIPDSQAQARHIRERVAKNAYS